ncbi:MAG: hypothetical protein Q7S96_02655 [bacterium]|nr:hypothetical protein [bacterium]
MQSALLVSAAMLLYAVQNVVIEQKFVRVPVVVLLVICYAVMLPLALLRFWHLRGVAGAATLPTGTLLALALGMGVVLFLADYCSMGLRRRRIAHVHHGHRDPVAGVRIHREVRVDA